MTPRGGSLGSGTTTPIGTVLWSLCGDVADVRLGCDRDRSTEPPEATLSCHITSSPRVSKPSDRVTRDGVFCWAWPSRRKRKQKTKEKERERKKKKEDRPISWRNRPTPSLFLREQREARHRILSRICTAYSTAEACSVQWWNACGAVPRLGVG